jgi:hypothetical protein
MWIVEERIMAVMAVDLNKKSAGLRAKRQAVVQAIAALQQLDAEYQDRKNGPRVISSRRSVPSNKTIASRRIA